MQGSTSSRRIGVNKGYTRWCTASIILIRAQPCYVSTNACRLHHFRSEISSSACIGLYYCVLYGNHSANGDDAKPIASIGSISSIGGIGGIGSSPRLLYTLRVSG